MKDKKSQKLELNDLDIEERVSCKTRCTKYTELKQNTFETIQARNYENFDA